MEEVCLDKKLKQMIKEFEIARGVLEFKVFKNRDYIDLKRKDLHFDTALNTINNDLLSKEKEQDFFNSGEKISLSEFYGNLVNIDEEEIILKGRKKNWNKYFKHKSNKEVSITYLNGGLGYAFFETPYGIKLKKSIKEEGDFFFDFFKKIFGDLSFIEVYKWSTDFSTYFDEGKEWWGEFYWTIYSHKKDYFIGIVASTTD